MKKIINICLFFLILFILLIIVSYIYMPKDNSEKAGMKSYGGSMILGEKENTVDLIVLGNSESTTSIIPMKLWDDYGYTTHICGQPGQFLPDSIKALYGITKKQKPKVIVLEADSIYDRVSITIPISRFIQAILPITEYHHRWKNLNLDDFFSKVDYKSTDYMKGFRYSKTIVPATTTNYMKHSENTDDIRDLEKLYLDIINDYCKKNNIKFILISVPSPKNWDYEKHNAVEEYAKIKEIDYIDFNLLTDELNIDWNNDTSDKGDHMNYYGSVKLTNYFGKYLSDNNLLKSHKDDKYYSKWNEDLKKYNETVNN